MNNPNAGSFASGLRFIGSWQLKVFDDVLRQGVKATFAIIDKAVTSQLANKRRTSKSAPSWTDGADPKGDKSNREHRRKLGFRYAVRVV